MSESKDIVCKSSPFLAFLYAEVNKYLSILLYLILYEK